MQNKLAKLSSFATFREAALYAKNMALKLKAEMRVERSGSEWMVLTTSKNRAHIEDTDEDFEDLGDEPNADWEEYEREVEREINDELSGDQESWASSEEDGWYYRDE